MKWKNMLMNILLKFLNKQTLELDFNESGSFLPASYINSLVHLHFHFKKNLIPLRYKELIALLLLLTGIESYQFLFFTNYFTKEGCIC